MEFAMKRNSMSSWRRNLHVRQVYTLEGAELRRILGLIGSFDGGGVIKGTPVRNLPTRSRWWDQSTRKNLSSAPWSRNSLLRVEIWQWERWGLALNLRWIKMGFLEVDKSTWRRKTRIGRWVCREEDMLELELDEDDIVETSKVLGTTVFYSRKSYNPQYLSSDMINAWGIQKLATVEKIGDYIFKIEFVKEEDKVRVLDGGPWRHKGDVLIVAHYDGLILSSENCIKSIGLWVRLYDLPTAMMKPIMAQQLGGGGQLGEFIKSDSRFLGYLRVRVKYPLGKPLLPKLAVKVKRRCQMLITLRYENTPHFCFSCGHIGHMAVNCEDSTAEERGVAYGEELQASLPRRVKEIMVKPTLTRVAWSFFQVTEITSREKSAIVNGMDGDTSNADQNRAQMDGEQGVVGQQNWMDE
jgi:hypothetical protein